MQVYWQVFLFIERWVRAYNNNRLINKSAMKNLSQIFDSSLTIETMAIVNGTPYQLFTNC